LLAAGALLRAEQVVVLVPLLERTNAKLSVTAPTGAWDGFGFLPVMVRAENDSDEELSWRLSFTTIPYFYYGSPGMTLQGDFSVTAPARTSRTTVFWVPGGDSGTSSDDFAAVTALTVQGSGVRDRAWSAPVTHHLHEQSFNLAVSPALEADYRSRIASVDKSRNAAPDMSVVRPSEWPADWRAWSPFDVAVMTADECAALDTARLAALREWVWLGGRLFLTQAKTVSAQQAPTARHGMGTITMADLPASLLAAPRAGGKRPVADLFTMPGADTGLLVPGLFYPQWPEEVSAGRASPWLKVAQLLDPDDAKAFRLAPATWGLVFFLLAFGVLVGPVNLFWLAPAGKRHRLFFTVPAISFGASLVLMAVIVLGDGLGGEGTRRALVMLMPGENKAVVAQQQVSRTGLLLGKRFPIADDTALAKTRVLDEKFKPGKRAGRQPGAATGDWFTSRARESHVLMRVTPTRGRVEFVAGNGGADARNADAPPVVQSSLAGTLRDFVYVDAAGRLWTADEVPPGRRVALDARPPGDDTPALLHRFAGWREAGRFYAMMSGGELAPIATLESVRWKGDQVFVTGVVEGGKGHE